MDTPQEALDLTVLVLGDEQHSRPMVEALEAEGFEVESARPRHARQSVQVAVPELVVALGDAVKDGGEEVRASVHGVYGDLPLFVVCPRSQAVLADLWKHDSIGRLDPGKDAATTAQRVAQTMRLLAAGTYETTREALASTEPKPVRRAAPAKVAAAPLPMPGAPRAGGNAPMPTPRATQAVDERPVATKRRDATLVGMPPAPPPAPIAVQQANTELETEAAPAPTPTPATVSALPPPPSALVALAKNAEEQLIREHEATSMPSVVVDEAPVAAPSPLLEQAAARDDATPLAWIRQHAPNPMDGWQRIRELLATLSLHLLAHARSLAHVIARRWTSLMARPGLRAASHGDPSGSLGHRFDAVWTSLRARRGLRMVGAARPGLRWALAGGALVPLAVAMVVVLVSTPNEHARALAPVAVRGALTMPKPAETKPAVAEATDAADADAQSDEAGGVDDEGAEPKRSDDRRARQIAAANKLVANGHRLRKAGRLGLAEDAYMSALKQLPRYPRAMAGLVRVHLQRRASVEALRWAKKLVERKPRSAQNQLLLGDAYRLMGSKAEARRAWRQAARYGSRIARKRLKG